VEMEYVEFAITQQVFVIATSTIGEKNVKIRLLLAKIKIMNAKIKVYVMQCINIVNVQMDLRVKNVRLVLLLVKIWQKLQLLNVKEKEMLQKNVAEIKLELVMMMMELVNVNLGSLVENVNLINSIVKMNQKVVVALNKVNAKLVEDVNV